MATWIARLLPRHSLALFSLVIVMVGCASPAPTLPAESAPLVTASPTAALRPTATPTPPGFEVHIVNRDGPTLDIVVNGVKAAQVACQPEGVGQPILRPGPALPALPWTIELKRANGGPSLASFSEDGTAGPRMILVRGTVASESSWPNGTGGFALGPCPT